MQYTGGKTRAAKHIVAEIQKRVPCKSSTVWWDPFCGGLSMSVALTKAYGPGISSDFCSPLISLYEAVAQGEWDIPSTLTKAEYSEAKLLPDSNPLKAFAGFGCSFGGKWFRGYARSRPGRDFAGGTKQVLLRDVAIVKNFAHIDFLSAPVLPGVDILYLDPPYRGTLGYGAVGSFDHDAFDAKARLFARAGSHVFVSEYALPSGELVWEREQLTTVALGATKKATERLYYLKP